MGFLTGPPSYRESLSASPHGARNTDTLDLRIQKTCSRDWDEESLVCSLGQYVVDASLELALATRFS